VICLSCGEELKPKTTDFEGEYAGVSVTVRMEGLVCDSCGYKTISGPKLEEFGRLVADQYRIKKGLLTGGDIRSIRENLGMSQQQFADHLGVGVASVKRWELGKVQEQSMDNLIRLKSSPEAAAENLNLLVRMSNPSPALVEHGYVLDHVVVGGSKDYAEASLTKSRSTFLGAIDYGPWIMPSVRLAVTEDNVCEEPAASIDLEIEPSEGKLAA